MSLRSCTQHLLFIDEHLVTGGIATLIARVSRLLLADGWRITLLTRKTAKDIRGIFPAELTVHELGDRFKWLFFPEGAASIARRLDLENVTLIYATGVLAAWLGSVFSSRVRRHPGLVCGVYTPWEFCYPRPRRFADFGTYLRCAHFDRDIPDGSKVFMSEVVRRHHERSFGRSLAAAPISVLPLDARMFQAVERRPVRCRVVSVGRLCAWKTYNLYLIEVIRTLRDKGYPVTWEVYGSGELEPEMRRRIQAAGLSGVIRLHGNLEYARLGEVLSDAGAFIGMGTALLEAGFGRVPAIVALDHSQTEQTYGYLYDLPLGACGELLENPPAYTITERLEKLFNLSDDQYRLEMDKTWQYVQPFEQHQVYQQLLQLFAQARPYRGGYWKFFAYNLHGLYRKLVRSIV